MAVTTVNLLFRQIDGAGGTELITAPEARVMVGPVRRSDTTSGELTTVAKPFALGSTIQLQPGTYRFTLWHVPDGFGGYIEGRDAEQVRLVPNSGTFDVDDLEEVSTWSADSLTPEIQAYIDQRIATVENGSPSGSGPGGAFISVDVTDTTVTGRGVMTAANAAAARTAIGAGTSNLAVGTTAGTAAEGDKVVNKAGAETITGVKTFTANPVFNDNAIPQAKVVGLSGLASPPDASTSVKGLIKLAGVLSGTADSPTAPGLAALSGATFTGAVTVPTPATSGHAATKGYVDGKPIGSTINCTTIGQARNDPNGVAFLTTQAVIWICDGSFSGAPTNALTIDTVLNRAGA